MKSKVPVRRQLNLVAHFLDAVFLTAIVMLILSSSSLAQSKLPFIGTRTFCGEVEGTSAIVTIRKDGYTTIKTNMHTILANGKYKTVSGKLNSKGILNVGDFMLTIKSGTDISVYENPNQDYLDGKLCSTNEVLPQESKVVKPPLTTTPKSASAQTYIEVSFKEIKDLEGLLKSFPILKNDLEVVLEENKDEEVEEKTQVYVSDFQQKGMPRLLFIAMNGLYCGAALCSLNVYIDQGKGFTDVLDALTAFSAPVYISKDQSSLLTCGKSGRGEWRLKNNLFEPVAGKLRLSQKLKPCTFNQFR